MKEETKEYALELARKEVLIGFDDYEEILEYIMNVLYEEDVDVWWLKGVINELYDKHQEASLTWTHPTDFDRLLSAFDELIEQKIVCLHMAGSDREDAISDCTEVLYELEANSMEAKGYCYYHHQDMYQAINPDIRSLFIGFGGKNENREEAVAVGNMVCDSLKRNGFKTEWSGKVNERIKIENINWQKVPGYLDLGWKRNMLIFKKMNPVLKHLPDQPEEVNEWRSLYKEEAEWRPAPGRRLYSPPAGHQPAD